MRLQNIIDSIEPAVMAKVEAAIARHEKTISDKEAGVNDKQIMSWYTEGSLLLQLESPLRLIEPSGLCEAAKIMSDERRQAAMQGAGPLDLLGGSSGWPLAGCL